MGSQEQDGRCTCKCGSLYYELPAIHIRSPTSFNAFFDSTFAPSPLADNSRLEIRLFVARHRSPVQSSTRKVFSTWPTRVPQFRVHSSIPIDQNAKLRPAIARGTSKFIHTLFIVDTDHYLRPAGKVHQSANLGGVYDFVC